jgi:hypothetical protein
MLLSPPNGFGLPGPLQIGFALAQIRRTPTWPDIVPTVLTRGGFVVSLASLPMTWAARITGPSEMRNSL